jgi:hypothetical protein
VTASLVAVGAGLRLRSRPAGVVAAASRQGRELQEAARAIFGAVRDTQPQIIAFIDGLEKVNGQAAQWFRDTFENTRLLIDADATIVIASPPCPFSNTNAAHQFGYVTHVLYGYGTDDPQPLVDILARRIEAAGLDPGGAVMRDACARCARESGGHPRHAVSLLKRAVQHAVNEDRIQLDPSDLDDAVWELRKSLALGLTEPDKRLLCRVDLVHELPNNEIGARLFGDGRILAAPPGESGSPSFFVHPLLGKVVTEYQAKLAALVAQDLPDE